MPYAKARDGCMLYYKDWGRGDPVLLMHGWPLTADTWDAAAMKLVEAGHRCVFYDRRGFGRSDQPWDGHDYDTYADDAAAVLEDAGVQEKVSLVGFSMGGGEVARFLTRQGSERVNKAVLISSVVPKTAQSDDNPDGVPESKLQEMTQQMETDRAAFMQTFFKTFFGVGMMSSPVSDQVLMNAWRQAMMAGLRPTLAAAKAFAETDFRPDLRSFDGVPTLCIHGTADKTVPIEATGEVVAREVLTARLIKYEGSPHGLFETDKDRLCDDLVAFLGGDMSRIDEAAESQSEARQEEPAY
ncbi:MAG TPA: alpha/beta hydrolase [Sphingomicrobium sp.]|nr:alpha/beta hydrolase [Sphingomicrobium sp.]